MKMLCKRNMVSNLRRDLRGIRKFICCGCKDSWIRFLIEDLDKLEDKEICYLWDNKKKFYSWVFNYIEVKDSDICYKLYDSEVKIVDIIRNEFINK